MSDKFVCRRFNSKKEEDSLVSVFFSLKCQKTAADIWRLLGIWFLVSATPMKMTKYLKIEKKRN